MAKAHSGSDEFQHNVRTSEITSEMWWVPFGLADETRLVAALIWDTRRNTRDGLVPSKGALWSITTHRRECSPIEDSLRISSYALSTVRYFLTELLFLSFFLLLLYFFTAIWKFFVWNIHLYDMRHSKQLEGES